MNCNVKRVSLDGENFVHMICTNYIYGHCPSMMGSAISDCKLGLYCAMVSCPMLY